MSHTYMVTKSDKQVTELQKAFGDKIRRARTSRGISQYCLAVELGLASAQNISNLERGTQAIPAKYLGKLARLLELNVESLVEDLVGLKRQRILSEVHRYAE